jgi:uncharacterized protein
MTELAKPALYREGQDGLAILRGMRCGCGRIAFPYQPFGCEQCGRTCSIEPADLAADGRIAAVAEVHVQPGDSPPAPFLVGAVKLDSGPMVRAYLEGARVRPGDRVRGALLPAMSGSEGVLDLRFAVLADESGGTHG